MNNRFILKAAISAFFRVVKIFRKRNGSYSRMEGLRT